MRGLCGLRSGGSAGRCGRLRCSGSGCTGSSGGLAICGIGLGRRSSRRAGSGSGLTGGRIRLGCGRSGGAVCGCGLTGVRSRSTGHSCGFALSCSYLGRCCLGRLRSCFFGRSVRSNGSRQRGGYIRGQHVIVVRGNDLRVCKDGRLNLQREAEGGYLSPVRCVQIYFGFLHPGGSESLLHQFDGDGVAVDDDRGITQVVLVIEARCAVIFAHPHDPHSAGRNGKPVFRIGAPERNEARALIILLRVDNNRIIRFVHHSRDRSVY